MDGFSCTPDHQEITVWPFSKTIWKYCINESKPLIFVLPNGHLLRIVGQEGFTDFGSLPVVVSSVPGLSPYRFPRAYLFHDNGYLTHEVEISKNGGLTWNTIKATRAQVDEWLCVMIQFEKQPGNIVLRNIIWSQVRLWGFSAWENNVKRQGHKSAMKIASASAKYRGITLD